MSANQPFPVEEKQVLRILKSTVLSRVFLKKMFLESQFYASLLTQE